MNEESLQEIENIVHDGELAQRVIDASHISMGQDLSEVDTQQLLELSTRAVRVIDFKREI